MAGSSAAPEITFTLLEYFVAVAEEGTISRGALRLHVSQPSLSRQLKELEARFGVVLLLRSRNGVRLTPAGEALLARARSLLQRRDRLLQSMAAYRRGAGHEQETLHRSVGGSTAQELKVGYIAPSLFGAVGAAVAELRERHPRLSLRVVEASPGLQPDMLGRGELDVAFLGQFPESYAGPITLIPVYRVPLRLVVPARHPLAIRSSVKLHELAHEPFVGLREELYPGRQETASRLCRQEGFTPTFVELADSHISLFSLIAHGRGLALLPAYASSLTYRQITFVPLDHPLAEVSFYAATRPDDEHPRVTEILSLCRAHGAMDSLLRSARANLRPSRAPAAERALPADTV